MANKCLELLTLLLTTGVYDAHEHNQQAVGHNAPIRAHVGHWNKHNEG